ncbi:Sulfate permease, Trk-type [Vibrio chagasii]|nr:Sulfate permease, Trk-type [Vibrio chagasii]CAH7166647.1 Sulfate permease, Trk-type [Vibrio chagasii]CAH7357790.1 Sulfate permease, Trk-type [Vibrio chagasii]
MLEWLISPAMQVILLFFATIIGLIRYQSHSDKVFGVLLLVLFASSLVSTEQVIQSFSNKGLLTLILLMICSVALEKTKLLRIITNYVIGPNYRFTWLRLFSLTTLSSAILNNTAVVSTMLAPIRNNPHHKASKLLLPLSYAAILGGTLTLVGTSTNLIVNSLVLDSGLPSLKFFDFTAVGLCLVLGCGVLLFILSPLLPEHGKGSVAIRDYLIDAEVSVRSDLVGKTVEQNGLRHLESLFLVEILRNGRLISPVTPQEVIQPHDRLLFSGDVKKVTTLTQFDGLSLFASDNGLPLDNLSEVVIRPESHLIGKTLKHAGFRALFDAAVVAIKRDGEALSGKLGDVELQTGDYLVLAVGEDYATRNNIAKNFFLLNEVKTEHCLDGWKEKLAIGGFLGAILLAATGIVSLFKVMLILLGLLLLAGCLSANEVLQRIPKGIWLIISSALLLSQALSNTGALNGLESLVHSYDYLFSPFMGLVVVYLLAWIMTELVTNNAAAALVFPIGIELASSLSVNPQAYILAIAFGASASFISPYGYQTNLMVFNAGQYKLQDFVKVGVPMCLLYGVIVLTAIPAFIGL